MLDIKFIRENPELIKEVAEQKNINLDIKRLLELDEKRRKLTSKIEDLRSEKNKVSKDIPQMAPEQRLEALENMKQVDIQQDELEELLKPTVDEFNQLMYLVPNIVSKQTPIGRDDSDNVEVKKWGEPRVFKFQPKSHEQLGLDLDIIDFERAVKIGGSRSYVLKGDGARLESAVLKYAIDFINDKNFELMNVPVIVNPETLFGTGHFPGSEEETYYLQKDNKYLVGTSEVPIASFYANEILDEANLPIRFAGNSVCFRREAGSYGKDTHGLYRVHQFNKVEQFVICPNDIAYSLTIHEELLKNSEEFLRSLNIPYRVLNVCTGDMGQGKYYMNDIESWMPSRNSYGETHSCSTLLDFQARRLNLRYKDKDGKINYCHTLNNTVVATPRILIPILENFQNEDGTITIPEVLRPYMNGQDIIQKKNHE